MDGRGDRLIGAEAVRAWVFALFGESVKVFRAFAELSELSENLRVLSLNAELVAGRAGDAGRAVRALTQYTRELVNRLAQAQADCGAIMRDCYRHCVVALGHIHALGLMERAAAALARDGRALDRVAAAREELMTRTDETVLALAGAVAALARQARVVESVVSASDSIATNIAIEAAGAGRHEDDFRTVAHTMRQYVQQLRDMTAQAGTAVRRAEEKSAAVSGGRGRRDAGWPAKDEGANEKQHHLPRGRSPLAGLRTRPRATG